MQALKSDYDHQDYQDPAASEKHSGKQFKQELKVKGFPNKYKSLNNFFEKAL